MAKEILLGYEVDTRKPVYMPLHHTGFTGMTQKAGKTTAIEGASMRSGMRAITFRTKRGEVGFETTGTEIKPYFLERSDWQYVESLIEATLRENQRFNRSWIIRACEGTEDDLNKVWENIKTAKKKAKGLALSVYTNLDAYFKIVLPEIRRYDFSKKLDIAESGVSVMNLIGMPTEVQALVIRSVIDQIYEHERNIIVVIPEAWKFIGITHTPVTYVAERLIREGASVGIYLFLDSQDISGINTRIRSQIDNWILGRQKYEHEIERTLKAIPVKNKPTKEQIQTLKLGHFYAACDIWARKIYFLPWQIPEKLGVEVAMGQKKPEYVKKILDERREKYRKGDDEELWKQKFEEEKRKREKAEKKLFKMKDMRTKIYNEVMKDFDEQVSTKVKEGLRKFIGENKRLEAEIRRIMKRNDALALEVEHLRPLKQLRDALIKILPYQKEKEKGMISLETSLTKISVKDTKPKEVSMTTDKPSGKLMYCAVQLHERMKTDKSPIPVFSSADLQKEASEYGWKMGNRQIGGTLMVMVREGLLIQEGQGYRLPSKLKITVEESK